MLSSRRCAQQCNTSTQRHGTPIPGRYTDARQQCCTIDTRTGEVMAYLHSIHAWQAESTFLKLLLRTSDRLARSKASRAAQGVHTHAPDKLLDGLTPCSGEMVGIRGILSWYTRWSRVLWSNHVISWCCSHEGRRMTRGNALPAQNVENATN